MICSYSDLFADVYVNDGNEAETETDSVAHIKHEA